VFENRFLFEISQQQPMIFGANLPFKLSFRKAENREIYVQNDVMLQPFTASLLDVHH